MLGLRIFELANAYPFDKTGLSSWLLGSALQSGMSRLKQDYRALKFQRNAT